MTNVPSEIPPEDVMNILVASDIHLGYAEKDGIRGEDSFVTFEEILSIARDKDVDLILLGGDLFHDSKPTSKCIRRCMSLLRKYCMGDKPVAVEFLSDQAENFKHCDKPVVNYEDPNLNISIPVFSIHGNHDDPSGYGRVSSLDLLSVSGLVNYFGKWTDLTQVQISPLLMRKGTTLLALYGLSYLKDERLARLFLNQNVKMFRPREDQEEWCNVFVLHQNRVDRGPKNFIQEDMLPDFLDLVVWGHEHECRIKPEWNSARSFFVCQPGSPVATSLCEGEAVPKHVALLSVYKKNFKVTPIPLQTVRPFVFDSIVLADCTIDFSRAKPSVEVQNYVQGQVELLIDQAAEQISGDPRQPELPLVRLRVEYAEESHMFQVVRFGLQYADRVANPCEIVLFRKRRGVGNVKSEGKVDKDTLEALANAEDHQGLSSGRVEKVVERYFQEVDPNKHLHVLSTKGLAEAASRFIDKDDKDALFLLIDHQMKKTVDHLLESNVKEGDIDQEIENFRLQRLARAEEEVNDARSMLQNPSRQKVVKKPSNESVMVQSDSDDNTEVDVDFPAPPASRGRGRGRARGANTTARAARGGSTSSRARGDSTTSRARAASRSQGRGRGEQQSTSQRSSARRMVYIEDSDDD